MYIRKNSNCKCTTRNSDYNSTVHFVLSYDATSYDKTRKPS